MNSQTAKLYELTYEWFPIPGGESYLESEMKVFRSKREAENYGREFEAETNSDLEHDDEFVYMRFVDARLVRQIDGYAVMLSLPTRNAERTSI